MSSSNNTESIKYGGESWSRLDPKEKIFHLIGFKKKVLDLGCATGLLGEKLKSEKKCYVVGLEIDPVAAKQAEQKLDGVFVLNLDDISNIRSCLNREEFDVIVAVDVLEHLRNPEETLLQLKNHLENNGQLIVSVPNIAHYQVRFQLLRGKFEYTEYGILDETHLKFFTRKSISDLVKKCGFKIELVYYTVSDSKLALITYFWPTLFANQFIVQAKKRG